MNIIKKIKNNMLRRINPEKYWIERGLIVGENLQLHAGCDFGSEPYLVQLGNHVRVNSGVNFITHDGGVWVLRCLKEKYQDIDIIKPIVVGNNVHIGNNSIIMPGVVIGDNVIVGCGSIVTHSIPSNSVVVGVPARVIENLDTYIDKHKKDFEHTKQYSAEQKKEYYLSKYNK